MATDLAEEQVTLAWPNLVEVPRKYRLTLVDSDTGERKQMRTTAACVFTCAPGGVRRFRLIADPSPAGTLVIANLHSLQTRAGQAITYTLSKDAAVTMEILSLAGTVLNTLTQGEYRVAGENAAFWDGRDVQGSLLPPGSYLCQVSATTEEGERVEAATIIYVHR